MNDATTSREHSDAAAAARRVMESKPTSLADALRQDWQAIFEANRPKSEKAAERRAAIRKMGRNTLDIVGFSILGIAGATVAVAGIDTMLPPNEVGTTVVMQVNGQGLAGVIETGLSDISDQTGVDVTGAGYSDSLADLRQAGVKEGYPGFEVEVTAYTSPIFGTPTAEAAPETIDIQLPTLPDDQIPTVEQKND